MGTTAAAEIRAARSEDAAGVVRLLEAADLPTVEVRERLADFVVAESGGRLVGAAGLEVHGGDGLLRSVVVDPSVRGRGVGGRLTERILAEARGLGLRRVYLLTTTAETFFPRHGFQPIAREMVVGDVRQSVEFREACPATAAVMVVEIG